MPNNRPPAFDDVDLPRPIDPVADDFDDGDAEGAETADDAANADEVPNLYPEAARGADRARDGDAP